MTTMDDIRNLKKQIFLYGSLVAVVCELISFFILGWDTGFLVGLIAGLAVAIINFSILAFTLDRMLKSGNKGTSSIGFFVRMILYCVTFYFCITKSYAAGAACLIGFLTLKVPMYYFYAIKPKFNTERKIRPEVQAMYDEEDKQAEDEYYGREE
ncbi:ATP synthase subunit I [Anaerovorax odorimutans]|uniref:ATP synthase subunit I n=1 Tax=Anaerovorax odorimutans TaxID=109327 RepID=A0ABT1RT59_9FIRM|nr:ATP synthase subunit I [Anaerovorax odorimutans]MCQ4638051.1 ATP synthase subunit I [Anaerovorax odorimutans]